MREGERGDLELSLKYISCHITKNLSGASFPASGSKMGEVATSVFNRIAKNSLRRKILTS